MRKKKVLNTRGYSAPTPKETYFRPRHAKGACTWGKKKVRCSARWADQGRGINLPWNGC